MGSSSEGSTNAVDQLLGHTKGPKTVPDGSVEILEDLHVCRVIP
jgi:hypothetical protein